MTVNARQRTVKAFERIRAHAVSEWEALKQSQEPHILIGTATCGKAAGALDVLQTINDELAQQNTEDRVVQVGCMGHCYAEPMVIIEKPGWPPICYGYVTPGIASRLVQDFQQRMLAFTTEVVRDLGWYLWNDPIADREVHAPIEGTDITMPLSFGPEDRHGEYSERNIDILPVSMHSDSPLARAQAILGIIERVVLPALPLIQAQGGQYKIDELMRVVGDYLNLPELADIVEFGPKREDVTQASRPAEMRQSPVTRRENVRINRPGGTRQGREAAMMNILLGARNQPSETAALATSG